MVAETLRENGTWTTTYEGGLMLKRYNESAPKVSTTAEEMMSIQFGGGDVAPAEAPAPPSRPSISAPEQKAKEVNPFSTQVCVESFAGLPPRAWK